MDLINLIKPKNGLLIKQLNSKVFKTLYEELSTFDTNKELLNDLEFLSLSCNLCEHIVDQQKKHFKALKLDKMKLVVSVFVVIYDSMTEEDIERLKQNIQFIYDNEMIKKVSTVRVLKKGLSSWISKQF
jgi:hypothetical protein